MSQEMIAKIVVILLGIAGLMFAVIHIMDYIKFKKAGRTEEEKAGSPVTFAVSSAVINFFDTLGIGSFAPATAFWRQFKLLKDQVLPGTLNTAFCIPVITQAMIFITEVKVEPITLISMLGSATIGAVLGAGVVSKFNLKQIRLYMSIALFAVFLIMLSGKLELTPSGGDALGLTGIKLVIGIVINFALGALMTLGIGLYAPCLALVYALGMSPLVAFPIMMGSCAFLMPAASIRFIKEGAYNRKATFFSAIGGIVGVFIAVKFVTSLPIPTLVWLVMAVLLYTSIKMFLDSRKTTASTTE